MFKVCLICLTVHVEIDSCNSWFLYAVVGQTLICSSHLAIRYVHVNLSSSLWQYLNGTVDLQSSPRNYGLGNSLRIAGDFECGAQSQA